MARPTSTPTPADLADALRTAERERRGIEFPSQRAEHEGWTLDWAFARAVALERDALRVADGETQVGWKLGWTSAAMREALGIERPNWGTLWDTQVVEAGEPIDLGTLLHPKVEPEFVWRRGQSDEGQWHVGLEIVDPRFPSFGFAWLDNTLDNSSAARVVVGDAVPTGADLTSEVRFEEWDGDDLVAVHVGSGAQVMGHPERAVTWLREQLAEEGLTLGGDDLVFTGGLAAPFDLVAGRRYRLVAGDRSVEVSASHGLNASRSLNASRPG